MKRLAFMLLVVSLNTFADEHHGHHRGYEGGYGEYRGGHHGDGDGWILPAIVGGAILGGAIYNYSTPPSPPPPPTYYYPPAPVYHQAPPIYPAIPYGYHQQAVLDPNCNCYKYALIPN